MKRTISGKNTLVAVFEILELAEDAEKYTHLHLDSFTLSVDMVSALSTLLEQKRWEFVTFNGMKSSESASVLGPVLSNQVNELMFLSCSGDDIFQVLGELRFLLSVVSLVICCNGQQGLTESHCRQLTTLLVNSPNLRSLNLYGTMIESPSELAPGISQARNLEVLDLSSTTTLGVHPHETWSHHQQQLNSDSDSDSDHVDNLPNKPLIQGVFHLLETSETPSRLKTLNIAQIGITNFQAAALFQLLETRSNPAHFPDLETLNLSYNHLGDVGIMALASSLPRMTKLRKLTLGQGDWDLQICGHHLLDGLSRNYSLEYFNWRVAESRMELGPVDARLESYMFDHYPYLNRGGRRFLLTEQGLDVSLWSWILYRAGTIDHLVPTELWRMRSTILQKAHLNTIYYLLQNSPVLLHERHSGEKN